MFGDFLQGFRAVKMLAAGDEPDFKLFQIDVHKMLGFFSNLFMEAGGEPSASLISDEFVDEIFKKFLATADVRRHFALLEHVGFQFLEARLAGFDFRADAAVP